MGRLLKRRAPRLSHRRPERGCGPKTPLAIHEYGDLRMGEHFDGLAAQDNRRPPRRPCEAITIRSHLLSSAASSSPVPIRRNRRRLGRPSAWEMWEIVGERNPPVLRFLIDRQHRRWEVGVIKSTHCNADMIRPQVGFPKHSRSACRAEMHSDLSSLLPVADIDFGRSLGANLFFLKEGSNAEHRAGSPLTLAAMAGGYGIGIGGCFDTQGTAAAMRGFRH